MQQHLLDVLVTDSLPEIRTRFPYRPSRIVESVADLVDELG